MDEHQFSIRAYAGPNIRCNFACLEFSFSCNDGQATDSSRLRQAVEQLGAEFADDARKEAWGIVEAVAHLAIALSPHHTTQHSCGREGNQGWVCVDFVDGAVTKNALILALRIVRLHSADLSQQLIADIKQQLTRAASTRRNGMVALMLREASLRRIPTYSVSTRPEIWQFGQGERGVHFLQAACEADSFTGTMLQNDKFGSSQFLRQLGLPHTEQYAVTDLHFALQAAERLGFPCVVKPIDSSWGRGVATGLNSLDEVGRAFPIALDYSKSKAVLVENHVVGHDYRITVAGGKLVWVSRRQPPMVTGDGRSTLHQLVESENNRRKKASRVYGDRYKPIAIDASAAAFLRDQDLNAGSVVASGRSVALNDRANISQGGTFEDVTAVVHPENKEMAETVARCLRLSSMGLDFITKDISQSWRTVDCAIIEINRTPGINGLGDAHCMVKGGIPLGTNTRVPSFLVVGGNSDCTVARLIEEHLSSIGLATSSCTADSPEAENAPPTNLPSQTLAARVKSAMLDPVTQAIVIKTDEATVQQHGLPIDHIDLAFWQASPDRNDQQLNELLSSCASRLVIRESELTTEEIRAEIGRTLDDCQGNKQRDDHVVLKFEEVSTDRSGDTHSFAILSVQRPPCIPVEQFSKWLSALLEEACDDPNPARGLLTVERVPPLVVAWSSHLLAVAQIEPPTNLEIVSLTDQLPFQMRQGDFRIDVAKHASANCIVVEWAVNAINGLINTYASDGAISECLEKLREQTRNTLDKLTSGRIAEADRG